MSRETWAGVSSPCCVELETTGIPTAWPHRRAMLRRLLGYVGGVKSMPAHPIPPFLALVTAPCACPCHLRFPPGFFEFGPHCLPLCEIHVVGAPTSFTVPLQSLSPSTSITLS